MHRHSFNPFQLPIRFGCQRWREGRDRYVPPDSVIDPKKYEIAALDGAGSDTEARRFLQAHHYARSLPATREKFGLYRKGCLVGVVTFSPPFPAVIATRELGGTAGEARVLSRLCLLDEVPGNGASFFVGEVFRRLRREGLRGVITYADPVPRKGGDGAWIKPGHIGTIYQALSACYLGRASSKRLLLFPDGTSLHADTAGKIRRGKSGWQGGMRSVSARLDMDLPAWARSAEHDPERARAFLQAATARMQHVQHPGNHKYVWDWRRGRRVFAPNPRAYPKQKNQALP